MELFQSMARNGYPCIWLMAMSKVGVLTFPVWIYSPVACLFQIASSLKGDFTKRTSLAIWDIHKKQGKVTSGKERDGIRHSNGSI